MKKVVLIIICMTLLVSSIVYGDELVDEDWLIKNKYFGDGGLRLEDKLNRAELATIVVRLLKLEAKPKQKSSFKDIENFGGGWALPYISLAQENQLVAGISQDKFHPSGKVTYDQLVTVFMRALGYRDGIDFSSYPDDYRNMALEIGLADMYIDGDREITRGIVLDTMVKTLNTKMKSSEDTLYNSLHAKAKSEKLEKDVELKDLVFNTLVSGVFKGELTGRNNFTGYKIVLLAKNGTIYEQISLGKSGNFVIDGFDIGLLAKLAGYKYEIYDKQGQLIVEDNLK